MAEFYKDHSRDPDTVGKSILDPFMDTGTTVVEALRLGCNVVGIDLNPVAWFIVKTEVGPVDLDELQAAFAKASAWQAGKADDTASSALVRLADCQPAPKMLAGKGLQ